MLSQKALLVYLGISCWSARKQDSNAVRAVDREFATQGQVGNYAKKLLPGAVELDRVHALANSMRKWFYLQSLPWLGDGARILSSKAYIEFIREYQKRKGEFNAAVDSFLGEYPKLRSDARAKLGNLFSESEYPSELRLRTKFSCDVTFLPLPEVQDFRTEILDSERDAFLSKMRDAETNATRECLARLKAVIDKATATLSNPNAKFKDTLIDNITDICLELPKWNVTDNAEVEAMRLQCESLAKGISPDVMRDNASERATAAQKLAEINAKMDAFMGGAQ